MHPIVPAIIPRSEQDLLETLTRVQFAKAVQIDLVDGVFAHPASWPYEPIGDVRAIAEALTPFDVEVDLMVEGGLTAAQAWFDIGVRRFIFHLEAIDDIDRIVAFKAESGSEIGFSISNDTPLSVLTNVINHCDFVQLMGIATIGSQHQPFDDRVIFRTAQLKAAHPDVPVMIDGSMNEETIPRLRDAGASRFAVGSAILAATDPEDSYNHLSTLL